MVRTVGFEDFESPIGKHFDVPWNSRVPTLMNLMMVSGTQWNEIFEVGWSTMFPFSDVVSLAPVDWCGAALPSASSVNSFDGGPLSVGGGAVFAANVDGYARLIERYSADSSVAAQPGKRLGR